MGKLQPGISLVKRELINCCHIPHRVTWDWTQRLDLAGVLVQQARVHTNIHTCHWRLLVLVWRYRMPGLPERGRLPLGLKNAR